jgi:8-oxo-dGTP pyrophosphatase MutT (NUDIX family)
MGRRSRHAAFVPDCYVFPGGRVDPNDYLIRPATPLDLTAAKRMGLDGNLSLARALAIAAVRETFEETGLLLAGRGNIGVSEHPEWMHWKKSNLAPQLHHLTYFGRAITSPISPIRFHARFFIVHADALHGELISAGELCDLKFYPVSEVLANLPIVDVTEFMLNRVTSYVAARSNFDYRTPVFSYNGETPFVHYE